MAGQYKFNCFYAIFYMNFTPFEFGAQIIRNGDVVVVVVEAVEEAVVEAVFRKPMLLQLRITKLMSIQQMIVGKKTPTSLMLILIQKQRIGLEAVQISATLILMGHPRMETRNLLLAQQLDLIPSYIDIRIQLFNLILLIQMGIT